MSKEEKANKYAVENIDSEQSIFKGLSTQYQDDIFDAIENAYSAGYTQAEQDLSSQLTACKEALRKLVEHHDRLKYLNPSGMDKHVEYGLQLYNQAKKLIK